jgi:ATP-dependent Clp protease adaptor protein ClpS
MGLWLRGNEAPLEDGRVGEGHHEGDVGLDTLVPARKRSGARKPQRIPRCHVILWDSDDHTYGYVQRMLRELFGHSPTECHQLAEAVDTQGRATVLTTTQEHAELKRDQIHAYGRDHLAGSSGSMWATIESEEA